MRERKPRKLLSLLLAAVMLLSLFPATALAANYRDRGERNDRGGRTEESVFAEEGVEAYASESDGNFYRIVHLDTGRKYFTVGWVESLIDEMALDGYTHLELAFGNDALRFLLDDMSVTVGETTYSSADVIAGIKEGNQAYYDAGAVNEWSEAEMDAVIAYANDAGIEIIPLLNTPGHMDAILDAMEYVGISNPAFTAGSYGTSSRTVNLENAEAVEFTQALVQKYITYFADQGSTIFHLGTDEYANDILINYSGMGFGYLQGQGKYKLFVDYVNALADMVSTAGMTPAAFNDGIYYNSDTSSGTFNRDLLITYWSNGWGNYSPASAQFLADKGLALINTHGDFYYVLGKSDNFDSGSSYADNWDNAKFPGTTFTEAQAGGMFCIWCDVPSAETENEITSKVIDSGVLSAMAEAMGAEPVENTNICYDTETGVEVNFGAEDVMEMIVEAVEVDDLAGKTYVAYNITPKDYTGPAVVTIPLTPELQAASELIGFVVEPNGDVTKISGTRNTDSYTFTTTHFSPMGVLSLDDAEPEITVTVGQNTTVTVNGDLSGTYTTENPSIATVSAEYTQVAGAKKTQEVTTIESGKQYLIVNTRANKLLTSSSATTNQNTTGLSLNGALSVDSTELWTITSTGSGYNVKNSSNKYLTISNNSASVSTNSATLTLNYSNGTWTIAQVVSSGGNGGHPGGQQSTTYYLNDFGGSGTVAAGWTDNNAATDGGSQWRIYEVVETDPVDATKITFYGVAKGTTYVTVGNVKYTINVVEEDLSKVTPLTVEYWITNRQVTANGATSGTIAATATGVHSESGARFSELVPAAGTAEGNDVVFWKGTRLASNNTQTTASGVDQTKSGTDFTYIRYWDGSWAYSADGETWTNVASGDQIVAYYLQKTAVTDEVTTQVVDWGPQKDSWSSLNYLGTKYILVDYTVKYESGDEYPSSFPTSNSLAFHCDTSTTKNGYYYRTVGMTRAQESSDYEVYLITVTPTSDNPGTTLASTAAGNTNYSYNGTEVVAWAATQDDLDNRGLGTYTSISGAFTYSIGGDPMVSGLEIYRQQGMKVTYYVRAKVTEDSLTVHYIDQTADAEFYNYNIAVTSGTTFDKNISLNTDGTVAYGTVTNSLNKTQTVSSDLSTMPAIGAQYRYSDYTCVKVERSEDGKEVSLYYTFDNDHHFVIDFGLPLKITATELGISESGTVTITQGRYGTVTDDVANKCIIYTPNQVLPRSDSFTVTLSETIDGEESKATHTIYVYPASNVLYEETFLNKNTEESSWTHTPANAAANQSADQTTLYGNDDAYQNSTGNSMGSAWTVSNLASGSVTDFLTTTFRGTGFDLIGTAGSDTGYVYLLVQGEVNKLVVIDTSYVGDDGATLSQVPLAHLELGDANADYTVYISAGYRESVSTAPAATQSASTSSASRAISTYSLNSLNSTSDIVNEIYSVMEQLFRKGFEIDDVEFVYADESSDLAQLDNASAVATYALDTPAAQSETDETAYRPEGTTVTIDGFRVYRSSDNANYLPFEKGVTYVNVLDAVQSSDACFTESDGVHKWVSRADYESNGGPQNEIYLANGQSVVLKTNRSEVTKIQVSARAVTNTAAKLNGTAISSNTEMYYEVEVGTDGTVTISNTGDGLLALGNLKVPAGTTFSEVTEGTLEVASLMLLSYYAAAPVEPEVPEASVFTPERLDVKIKSTNVILNKLVTVNVTASTDVAQLVVNGKVIQPSNSLMVKLGLSKTYTYIIADTVKKTDTKTYEIVAYNADGVASETRTVQG